MAWKSIARARAIAIEIAIAAQTERKLPPDFSYDIDLDDDRDTALDRASASERSPLSLKGYLNAYAIPIDGYIVRYDVDAIPRTTPTGLISRSSPLVSRPESPRSGRLSVAQGEGRLARALGKSREDEDRSPGSGRFTLEAAGESRRAKVESPRRAGLWSASP